MLIVKWFVIVVVLLAVVAVAAGQLGFLQGTAPTDLGVRTAWLLRWFSSWNGGSACRRATPGRWAQCLAGSRAVRPRRPRRRAARRR